MNTPSMHTAPAHKASEGVAGRHHGRMAACLGAILLVAALVCNEWALAHLFSNDGRVDGFNLFLVRAFQVVAAGAGIGLVLWRNSIRLMGLAVAFASILLLFAAAELFFRALAYMRRPVQWPATVIQNPHGTGSYRLAPNLDFVHPYGDMMVAVRTNSHGMRWRAMRKEKGIGMRRVAFVGDSFTFGESADDLSHSFVSLFEKHVGTDSVEAMSFGVPGYGIDDIRLQLEEEVLTFSPDHVVLALFAGNDVRDTYLGIRKYILSDGRLKWKRSVLEEKIPAEFRESQADDEVRPGLVGFVTRLHMLIRLRHAYYSLARQRAPAQTLPKSADDDLTSAFQVAGGFRRDMFWSRADYPQVAQRALDATLSELDRIRDITSASGVDFMLVLLPFKQQVAANQMTGTDARGIEYDIDRPQCFLRAWATEHGVPCLDLLDEFRARIRKERKPLYAQGTDMHFNTLGHKVAGEAIAAFFHEHVVVKGQATN